MSHRDQFETTVTVFRIVKPPSRRSKKGTPLESRPNIGTSAKRGCISDVDIPSTAVV